MTKYLNSFARLQSGLLLVRFSKFPCGLSCNKKPTPMGGWVLNELNRKAGGNGDVLAWATTCSAVGTPSSDDNNI